MGEGLEAEHVSCLAFKQQACYSDADCLVDPPLWTLLCECSTPQLNLQFTARSIDGDVLDYFSKQIDSHGDWQQVAVAYSGENAEVQFYVNGFPLDMDLSPQVWGICQCAVIQSQVAKLM